VLPYYKEKGQLVTVDGMQDVEQVRARISDCLDS